MRIDILTVLPEMIEGMVNCSIVKRAQDKGLAEIHLHNLRDYTTNKWRRVDDYLLARSVDSIWGFQDSAVYVQELDLDSEVLVKYMDRAVRFKVVEHEEKKALLVIKAANSSLNPNDILHIYKIEKGERLEAEKVFRGDLIGNYKTSSKLTTVVLI